MADNDSEFDGGDSPASVENHAAEVSDVDEDQEAGAGEELEGISTDEEEQDTGLSEKQAAAESPVQLEDSGTQDSHSSTGQASFQLSAGDDEDVFGPGSDSDSDVEISAAIEAITNVDKEEDSESERDSPPVKRKARLLSDSDLEEMAEKSPTEAVEGSSPAKKHRVEDGESRKVCR